MDLLQIRDLCKDYSGVPVLSGVSLSLAAGEILGLIGENGAGKSTLIKCLNGMERFSGGEIRFGGVPVRFGSPAAAIAAGIVTVPQEFNLIPELNVAENFFLGCEPVTRLGLLDRAAMRRRAAAALERLHCRVDPETPVAALGVADRQFLEIARALDRRCRLLIMDEPTTVLNAPETEILFGVMRELSAAGVAMIFVSHKLPEVKAVCDRITVLRDGRVSGGAAAAEVTPGQMAEMMVGRELRRSFPPPRPLPETAPVALEVTDLEVAGVLSGISFALRRGEILGVAGLGGSGRSELAETLYGLRRMTGGAVRLNGRPVRLRSPRDAVAHGVALLPEDRQGAGVLLDFPVRDNLSLEAPSGGWIDRREEERRFGFFRDKFRIRCASPLQEVRRLSGGNQQKVAIGKQLATSPEVFLFDEPTRGVDIGARGEVYGFIDELAAQGVACLLISSDLEEVIGMCRRVLVMRGGRLAGELAGDAVNEREIMYLATGVKE